MEESKVEQEPLEPKDGIPDEGEFCINRDATVQGESTEDNSTQLSNNEKEEVVMSASKMDNYRGGLGTGEEDEAHKMNDGVSNDNVVKGGTGQAIDESASASSTHQQQGTVPITRIIVTRNKSLSQSSGEIPQKPKNVFEAFLEIENKKALERNVSVGPGPSSDGSKHDRFCWYCHKDDVTVNCKKCPRSYHSKCMSKCKSNPNKRRSIDNWDSIGHCPECEVVMRAETVEFRSESMKQLTQDQLLGLLKIVCWNMKKTDGAGPFLKPIDPKKSEDYFDYIVHPMDIETLETNVKNRKYRSTEGFLADAQWLVHNSTVFNASDSQYTLQAKRLLKTCKQELSDIETCHECCLNRIENPDEWFIRACRRPHIVVWAKLTGHPYWPAKAMKSNEDKDQMFVSFFGQHDGAWVSNTACFLYSQKIPGVPPKNDPNFAAAVKELAEHIDRLKQLHGGAVLFAPPKTVIGSQINTEQIRQMLPKYNPPEEPTKIQIRPSSSTSNAKTSTSVSSDKNGVPPPPPAKSLVASRSSSLKTNPTYVKNSTVSLNDNAGTSSSIVCLNAQNAAGSGITFQKLTGNTEERVTSSEQHEVQDFDGKTTNLGIHVQKWFSEASHVQKEFFEMQKQKDDSEKKWKAMESRMMLHVSESESKIKKLQEQLEGKAKLEKEHTDLKEKVKDLEFSLKSTEALNRQNQSQLEGLLSTNSKLEDEVKEKENKNIVLQKEHNELESMYEKLRKEYLADTEAKKTEFKIKRNSLLSRFPKRRKLENDEDTDSDN